MNEIQKKGVLIMTSEFISNLKSFDDINIEIINWDKYNKRDSTDKSVFGYKWFKISNDHLTDAKIIALPDSAYKLFIALLCIASQQNKQIIDTHLTHLRRYTNGRIATIKQNLNKMCANGLIQIFENIENESLHIRKEKIRKDKNIYQNSISVLPVQNSLSKITDLWLSVLSTFGIERNKPHLQEAQMLHSLLESNGYENLALAIIGMAYETKSDSYNPERFLGTKLLANNFERFLNLGAKNKTDFIKRNVSKLTKESFDLVQRLDGNHA